VVVAPQSIPTTIQSKLAAYAEAKRRAATFLLRHLNGDGSLGPVDQGIYYYRAPWALARCGETGAAMRVLDWIQGHMLTTDGEVAGTASPNAGANRQANTYAETCLAFGAHLLGRYDIGRRAMAFALRFQDPATGGVFQDRQESGADGPQILFLTCQLGMSALMTGHRAAALGAGSFLKRLWEAQPELPDRLYAVLTRAGGLATVVPDGADRRHYVNESQDARQYHYNGGMAAAFLVQLYLATDDARWLDLARAYQAFSMNSTERQFEVMQVCKSAWGSALLYAATRDPLYRDWTLRMGDWFVAHQHADSHWENSRYLDPDPPLHHNLAITAEFIVHLDTIEGTSDE
jgi:hypothetical protein